MRSHVAQSYAPQCNIKIQREEEVEGKQTTCKQQGRILKKEQSTFHLLPWRGQRTAHLEGHQLALKQEPPSLLPSKQTWWRANWKITYLGLTSIFNQCCSCRLKSNFTTVLRSPARWARLHDEMMISRDNSDRFFQTLPPRKLGAFSPWRHGFIQRVGLELVWIHGRLLSKWASVQFINQTHPVLLV